MLLGDLISGLQLLPRNLRFRCGLWYPHSYRGSYDELAFEPLTPVRAVRGGFKVGGMTAGEILDMARDCVGAVFYGYKGGEFTMYESTPVHVAEYGNCGPELTPEFFVLDFKLGEPLQLALREGEPTGTGEHYTYCAGLASTYGL